jgi:hypothetical protein
VQLQKAPLGAMCSLLVSRSSDCGSSSVLEAFVVVSGSVAHRICHSIGLLYTGDLGGLISPLSCSKVSVGGWQRGGDALNGALT